MSADTRLRAGTWCRDDATDSDTRFIVVETTDTEARECFVPALDTTLDDWPTNADYPATDAVVRVVPTTFLADRFGDGWHVSDVLDAYDRGELQYDGITVYNYPRSRLNPIQ